MKLREVEQALQKQGMTVFTSQEFRRAAGLTPASAKMLLVRYVKKGYIHKWKDNRGLYSLGSRQPHPWLIANKLRQPSYVSLETALAHYGLLPEAVYTITSVTPKTTMRFVSQGTLFTYQKIKGSAFSGYRPLSLEGQTVWVAEPEKALADYLYFVHLGKKPLNDRLRWRGVKVQKVFTHLKRFQRASLLAWVKHVIPR